MILVSLVNEALPLIFGTGEDAPWDWSFLYVSLKFLVLPGVTLFIFAILGLEALRRPHPSRWSIAAGVVAAAYLVVLFTYPLPWFDL